MIRSWMRSGIRWLAVAACIGAGAADGETASSEDSRKGSKPAGTEIVLFDGTSLRGWKVTDFAGHGDVRIEDGLLVLEQGYMTGVHWTNDVPETNYEITLEARRVSGSDFFCDLTFPIARTNASLIVGGWGGGLVGISSIDGYDASENETTQFMSFERNKWYPIRVRVTPEKLEAWVDGKKVADVETRDRKFGLRAGPIEESVPLGISTYETTAHIRNVVLRRLE